MDILKDTLTDGMKDLRHAFQNAANQIINNEQVTVNIWNVALPLNPLEVIIANKLLGHSILDALKKERWWQIYSKRNPSKVRSQLFFAWACGGKENTEEAYKAWDLVLEYDR